MPRRAPGPSRPAGPTDSVDSIASADPGSLIGPAGPAKPANPLAAADPAAQPPAGGRLLRIGLTGGIGSGKTRVADYLEAWGAAVIDTDRISHELTGPGGGAMAALAAEFGPAVVAGDGSLDRAAMRELAFADAQARRRLEALLHPLIAECTAQRAARARGAYLVFVVPLLVESGRWAGRVDRVCVVDCDSDTQLARVQARSGLTASTIRRIMAAQATREARLAAAHDVIVNDGATTPGQLRERARMQHERWRELAQASGFGRSGGGPFG